MSRARTQRLETEASPVTTVRLARDYECTFYDYTVRKVSLAGIEPVGFRVKSDLRNHQAIVQPRLYDSLMVSDLRNHQAIIQPRLYDSLMVTQITLRAWPTPRLAVRRPAQRGPLTDKGRQAERRCTGQHGSDF